MRIQRRYASNGIQLVGIALDDVPKIRDYAAEMRIDYALLIGRVETLAETRDLGNREGVLPFTLVLDRTGKVVYAHAGALTEVVLDTVLSPLL
jgi:peroxiredoxin